MSEVGCLKNGCFQNLQVEGLNVMSGGFQRRVVPSASGAVALTPSDTGKIFVFTGAATTVTLPICSVGVEYIFLVGTTVTGATIITTQTADKLYGSIIRTVDGLAATHEDSVMQVDSTTGTNDNTLTMSASATTQGGIIGGKLHVIGMKANAWYITGTLIGSGDQITGFS
jgi:hypothetical protein